jgi:SNF2 family DNA or RNA helicase
MPTQKPTTVSYEDGLFVVKMDFEDRYIAMNKKPLARWERGRKVWTFPGTVEMYEYLIDEHGITPDESVNLFIEEQNKLDSLHDVKVSNDLPQPNLTHIKLWNHQKQAFYFMKELDSAALFAEMGTGKTLVALNLIYYKQPSSVLIVCPKAVISVWAKEFKKFPPTNDYDFEVVELNQRSTKKKLEVYKMYMAKTNINKIFVINYESIWRAPLGTWILEKDVPQMVIADESHRIKSPSSKVGLMFSKLSKLVKNKYILTGTPTPNGAEDYFGQFRFIKPSLFGKYFNMFAAKYVKYGGFDGREIIGYKNLEDLNEKVYNFSFRVKASDVLDLPEIIEEEIELTLSNDMKKYYNKLKQEKMAEYESGEVTIKNAATAITKLQQVVSGFILLDKEETSTGKAPQKAHMFKENRKLDLLIELLEGIDKNHKVVVFCNFTVEIKIIKEALEKAKIKYCELSGQKHETAKFQDDPKTQVILVQYKAGGVGVDLSMARYVFYFSPTYNLGDFEQSKARIHRPGQKHVVNYYYFITTGTVEKRVYSKLRKKEEIVNMLDLLLEELKESKNKGDEN